jgi:hypothetical protein
MKSRSTLLRTLGGTRRTQVPNLTDPLFDLIQPSGAAQRHEFFRIVYDSIAIQVTHP